MLNSSYAVLKTKKLEETAKFYEDFFEFERTYTSDWYVSLKNKEHELAILLPDHETIPEKFRGISTGREVILNFEVEDVDKIYKNFMEDNRIIHLEIRDEPWGQRHFISEDPNGVALDVIKVIPPSEEFLKSYNS